MINIKYHLIGMLTVTSMACASLHADTHEHDHGPVNYIHEGHADIALHYDPDHGLEFLVLAEDEHDHEEAHEADHEHEHGEHDHGELEGALHLDEALFVLGGYAVATIPNNPALSFLGEAGTPIYLAGQQQAHGVPFIGWNTEHLDSSLFTGQVTIELHAFTGPGHIYLYEVDSLGAVTVIWNTADEEEDVLTLDLGIHRHLILAVTAEGKYILDLDAQVQQEGGEITSAHGHLALEAGGIAGYYGHFEWPTDEWLWAETGGWLYVDAWPWVWQPAHGWLYAYGHGGPNHFYYKSLAEDWLWTSPDVFPNYWSFDGAQWAIWE